MKYLLVLLLLLAGCTQTVSPSSSPSTQAPSAPSAESSTPSASPTCSPMGGTPSPCSAEEYRKVEEQNRLTEEAIALYRRWTKESTRLYRAGGTNKATPEMLATTAGDFLASVLGIFQDLKAARARAISGEVKIASIGPDLDAQVTPGSTAIIACLDARSLKFHKNGKFLRSGVMFVEYFVAKPVKGELRLWSASSEGVTRCPA